VSARHLHKTYRRRSTSMSWKKTSIAALNDVDLTIPSGAVVGLIGPSGSGKTTLARCIAGVERPDSGEVWLAGKNLYSMSGAGFRELRRSIQLIFQDAAMAFNPRMTLEEIVAEPLRLGGSPPRQRRERSHDLLEQVGLLRQWSARHAAELSGGQRQRVAIARALAADPTVLILDESLSGLDLLTQTHVIDLLLRLREATSISYLFISHDLRLARRIATEIAVIHEGRIVERGSTRELLASPAHPCTRSLVDAMPSSIPGQL